MEYVTLSQNTPAQLIRTKVSKKSLLKWTIYDTVFVIFISTNMRHKEIKLVTQSEWQNRIWI